MAQIHFITVSQAVISLEMHFRRRPVSEGQDEIGAGAAVDLSARPRRPEKGTNHLK